MVPLSQPKQRRKTLESRTAFRGAGTPKGLIVLCALSVSLGLTVLAGYVAKSVTTPAATHTNMEITNSGPFTEPVDSFDGSSYGLIP
jgi:hypothetical protein